MKKSKKVVISAGGKKALIDATNKQSISIVPMHENSSFLELEKELQEMNDSIERIRQKYYTTDATLQRIQSRTLREIYSAKIRQLVVQSKGGKKIKISKKQSR